MPDGILGLRMSDEAPAAVAGRQLRDFVHTLREGWGILLGCIGVALLLGVVAIRIVPAQHTATMVVGPTARLGVAAMGARLPVLKGYDMAAAAAEPGPGDEILSDFARYLELLNSIPVAERLMGDVELLRALFPDRWDEENGRWRTPSGLVPWCKRLFLSIVGREDWVEPDAERVARALQDRIVIETIRTGPMRRISLRHTDRNVALRLLGTVAAATDAHLRAEASRRSAAQIAYVRSRMAGVTVAEHRRALADLLSEQERVAMMIEVDLPLAADTIEFPAAARLPDWPNPLLIVPMAGLLGLFLGALFLCLRRVWRSAAAVTGAGE